MKDEFVFQIEQDDDMLVAVCHEPEMATQGENLDELLGMIRDLIRCRFEEGDEHLGWPIRLHFLNDPVLTAQTARSCHATSPAKKFAAH
jgi:predicted RNase H-like HicB family nuclease